MGRRAHKTDSTVQRQVEAMAGFGVPEADIAGVIGTDPKTLRKHYRPELDHGHIKANVRVAENLYRKATGEGRESVIAAIFWLKTRAGWRETSVHEIFGHHGAPIEVEVIHSAREEIARRLRAIAERTDVHCPPIPGAQQDRLR
jgi:hypothetical protein